MEMSDYVTGYIAERFGDITQGFHTSYDDFRENLLKKNKGNRKIYAVFLNGVNVEQDTYEVIDAKKTPNWLRVYRINKASHYLKIYGLYSEKVETALMDYGFREVADYLFLSPRPITISGNVRYYHDARDNEIYNLQSNVTVNLFGYGNHLRLPQNVSSGPMKISLHNQSRAIIDNGAHFEDNAAINIINESELCIGNSKFLRNTIIGCDTQSKLIIGNGSVFGRNNIIETNSFHTMILGQNLLTSWEVTFLSGDGHSVFDQNSGKLKKINYKAHYCREQTILIGDHVWIGNRVLILRDTIIGSGCYIGANSFVKGTFKNNSLLLGSPAESKRRNRVWHANPHACSRDLNPLYSLPTESLPTHLLRFCWIQNLAEYCAEIARASRLICVIAVMDIVGHWIRGGEQESLSKTGVKKNLVHGEQRGYIFISTDGKAVCEHLTDKPEAVEYTGNVSGHELRVLSAPLPCGNRAVIEIDGKNYATNRRGLNFVLFDEESNQLVDSVAFDTHVRELTCHRKILFV